MEIHQVTLAAKPSQCNEGQRAGTRELREEHDGIRLYPRKDREEEIKPIWINDYTNTSCAKDARSRSLFVSSFMA